MKLIERSKLSAAVVCALGMISSGAFAQTQTAQSAMVQLTPLSSAYVIEGTITWTYDRDFAETFYGMTITGPTITCKPNGNKPACVGAQPATPSAPTPIYNPGGQGSQFGLQQQAQGDRCTFFDGGQLSTQEYFQTAEVKVGSGNNQETWTFEYKYTSTGSVVDALTAWTSEETGGVVDLGFDGFVASESFQSQANRKKYSFTMVDGGVSRARNVSATLWKDDLAGPQLDLNKIDTNGDLVNDALEVFPYGNFTYFGNAGSFGNSVVFAALHSVEGAKAANTVDYILKGDIASNQIEVTNRDNFAGNDNDVLAGNVHGAPFAGTFEGISDAGTYRIRLNGQLKGNDAAASFTFNVTSNAVVIGLDGCL